MAAANDVKAAKTLKAELIAFDASYGKAEPEQFMKQYKALLRSLQHDLGDMQPMPIVSLADQAKGE